MIIVNLDVMMAKRKISSYELAEKVGITPTNLSIFIIYSNYILGRKRC